LVFLGLVINLRSFARIYILFIQMRFYLFIFLFSLGLFVLGKGKPSFIESAPIDSIALNSNGVETNNNYDYLIDSLASLKAPAEKVFLALKIANVFKDGNWNRCYHYIEIAEKNALDCNNNSVLIDAYSQIGDIYYSKDILDVALKYYTKAYNLFPTDGYSVEKQGVENDIAVIYARLKKMDKAFYYFQRIAEYSARRNDTVNLAKVYNNIGLLYFNENVDSSIYYYEKSLDIAYKLNNAELNVYIFTNIAKCYAIKGNTEKTKLYLYKAEHLIDKTNVETKVLVYSTIADDFLHRSEPDSSIIYAIKAIDLMKGDKYNFAYMGLLRILSKAYLDKKEWEIASKTFAEFEVVRDSMNIEQKAVNAEMIKLKQDLLVSEQKRAIEDHKKKELYLTIGFSLVLGLLVLFILLIINKNRLQKSNYERQLIEASREVLNADLDSKKRMLVAKAMKEIHRAEFVQDILVDLKEIKLKAVKKETQASIDVIQRRLQKDTSTNIWEEFELSLSQVHEEFFTNLDDKHPDLSPKDKRLCALLVLNLSSKEIAQITGQDFKTVENARTRLRKKLNLTNTKIDLIAYLNSLK